MSCRTATSSTSASTSDRRSRPIIPRQAGLLAACLCLALLFGGPNAGRAEDGSQTGQASLAKPAPAEAAGGLELLLRVEWRHALEERLHAIGDALASALDEAGLLHTDLRAAGGVLTLVVGEPGRAGEAAAMLREINPMLDMTTDGDGRISAAYPKAAVAPIRDAVIRRSIEALRRGLADIGITASRLSREDEDRIRLLLPPGVDAKRLDGIIRPRARLTFHQVDESVSAYDVLAGLAALPAGSMLLPSREAGPDGTPVEHLVLRSDAALDGESLVEVNPETDPGTGQPMLVFRLDSQGAGRFAELTERNVGRRFAIVLDGEVISAPRIQSPITGGSGVITGTFTIEEAEDLARRLRPGSLPVPLTLLEERVAAPASTAGEPAAAD